MSDIFKNAKDEVDRLERRAKELREEVAGLEARRRDELGQRGADEARRILAEAAQGIVGELRAGASSRIDLDAAPLNRGGTFFLNGWKTDQWNAHDLAWLELSIVGTRPTNGRRVEITIRVQR